MYRVFMPNGKVLESTTTEALGVLIGENIVDEVQSDVTVVYNLVGPLSRRMVTAEDVEV